MIIKGLVIGAGALGAAAGIGGVAAASAISNSTPTRNADRAFVQYQSLSTGLGGAAVGTIGGGYLGRKLVKNKWGMLAGAVAGGVIGGMSSYSARAAQLEAGAWTGSKQSARFADQQNAERMQRPIKGTGW